MKYAFSTVYRIDLILNKIPKIQESNLFEGLKVHFGVKQTLHCYLIAGLLWEGYLMSLNSITLHRKNTEALTIVFVSLLTRLHFDQYLGA